MDDIFFLAFEVLRTKVDPEMLFQVQSWLSLVLLWIAHTHTERGEWGLEWIYRGALSPVRQKFVHGNILLPFWGTCGAEHNFYLQLKSQCMLLLATTTTSVIAPFSISHFSNLARRTVRCVQNKNLFLTLAYAVFGRLAAGQRVTSLERSSCLIKKQTCCLSQKTESQHILLFISDVSLNST